MCLVGRPAGPFFRRVTAVATRATITFATIPSPLVALAVLVGRPAQVRRADGLEKPVQRCHERAITSGTPTEPARQRHKLVRHTGDGVAATARESTHSAHVTTPSPSLSMKFNVLRTSRADFFTSARDSSTMCRI